MATADTIDKIMRPVSRIRFTFEPMTRLMSGPKRVTAAKMPYCSPAVGAQSLVLTRAAEMNRVAELVSRGYALSGL
jgi:hypothetical protein